MRTASGPGAVSAHGAPVTGSLATKVAIRSWVQRASQLGKMRAVNQSVVQLITLGPVPLQAVTGHPDGTYSFSDVVNMNYIVTPNKTGLTFSPASTAE